MPSVKMINGAGLKRTSVSAGWVEKLPVEMCYEKKRGDVATKLGSGWASTPSQRSDAYREVRLACLDLARENFRDLGYRDALWRARGSFLGL